MEEERGVCIGYGAGLVRGKVIFGLEGVGIMKDLV